jgi:DNA repair photolyase
MRWATTGDEPDGLFPVMDLFDDDHGTGRMSQLEFLPVLARTVLNRVPPGSRAPSQWTINAYRGCSHACTYCFARPTHEYLGMSAGDDFDRKIVVKINAVEVLKSELADPRWARESVAMGTNTDPYQRAEAKFRLTRGIIGALADAETPFSILTKSPLVTRDLDLLTEAAGRLDVSVSFSIGTLDQSVWRASEPGTPNPLRRIEAMRAMADAGIRTGALVAPILPGLSDRREQIQQTVDAILDTGGRVIGSTALYLRGSTREHFLTWLQGHDAQLHAKYLRRYAGRATVSAEYQQWVQDAVSAAIKRHEHA